MPNNPLMITIIVGAVAVVLGAIVGYVGALLESRLNKTLDEAREVTDPEDPNYKPPVPTVNEHDILKVTIDPALKMHLALDGVEVESDGLTAEQRARLVSVIVQIRPWIDGKTVAAEPLMPMPAPEPKPAISSIPSTPLPPPSTTTPVTSMRLDPRRGFLSWIESDMKKPEPLLTNNLISLIDEVLQKKLEVSPLATRKIRIEAGPNGEVIVYVGSARYPSVDQVPDPAIQSIIQESIKEWNDQ